VRLARILGAAGVAALALVAAGCGGSKSPGVASLGPAETTTTTASSSGGKPTGSADFVKFAHCMQSHGVDAQVGPGGQGIEISGVDPQSQTMQKAQQACSKLLPGGGPKPLTPAQQAQALKQLVKLSKCMRAHGIKDFPDPSSLGGLKLQLSRTGDLNPASAPFQAAMNACGQGKNGKGGIQIRVRDQ